MAFHIYKINNITTRNDRTSQRIGLTFRTQYRKWPSAKVGYTHGFNQLRGVQSNDFQTQNFTASFDHEIIKNIVFKTNYDWNKNLFENRTDSFDRLDISLEYKRKNNPWLFELKVNNAFNTQSRFNNRFSDFLIYTQQTFLLPRVVVFMVS